MNGVVLVAKPSGPTSHDVVDMVRRALDTSRVGHLGTLDPFATGLLVIVVGRVTRLAAFAGAWSKAYSGVIRLGTRTATDDATGAALEVSESWRGIDRARVSAALDQFRGAYDQEPPAYSAAHVDGERAYRRARRGETVALAPRRVEVHELELTGFDLPDIRFHAVVTAGTYLRSLARDVGVALGCGAHLAALERTAVGPFSLADAIAPRAVSASDLRGPETLVGHLPRHELDASERAAVLHGRPVAAGSGTREAGSVALFAAGQLVAVAEPEGGLLKPRVVVAEP